MIDWWYSKYSYRLRGNQSESCGNRSKSVRKAQSVTKAAKLLQTFIFTHICLSECWCYTQPMANWVSVATRGRAIRTRSTTKLGCGLWFVEATKISQLRLGRYTFIFSPSGRKRLIVMFHLWIVRKCRFLLWKIAPRKHRKSSHL